VVRVKIHAERTSGDEWHVVIEGSCTFLSLPRLTATLASVPPATTVTVEMTVDFLDHAAHEAIDQWRNQHEASGGTVYIHDLGAVEMARTIDKPPRRAFAPIDKRAGVVPWSSWQNNGAGTRPRSVANGLAVYHRRTAPFMLPHMRELAN